MNEAEQIKIATAAYWRFIKGHPLAAIECKNADVLSVARNLYTVESEVKVSLGDMQREIHTKRYKHWCMGNGEGEHYTRVRRFFFVVPERLESDAASTIKNKYPYAGLLVFHFMPDNLFTKPTYLRPVDYITEAIPAQTLKSLKIDVKMLLEIANIASNNTLKFAGRLT